MAKRELSSTLRNLKFMQRATRKEEAAKKDEEKPIHSTTQNRKCIVIMEGDPHPGALKGRMSFQSFNPFVDKLNEEAEGRSQSQHHDASKAELSTDRGNGAPESESDPNIARTDSESDDEHKTKKPKVEMDMVNESQFTRSAGHSKPSNNKAGTSKQQSQGRFDWKVLRPPTGQNKQRS
ncbi:uncharacterized protein LOC116253959 [Nymphaea colorata]|nr:uncharacterized protein LOC116253959 [Nymphaea colorata]